MGGEVTAPVGSTAVRDAIERHQPLVSLHGHIHESGGTVRLGRTLAVNAGLRVRRGRAPRGAGDRRRRQGPALPGDHGLGTGRRGGSDDGDTGGAAAAGGGRRAVRVRGLHRPERRAQVQVRAPRPTSRTWPPGPSCTPSGALEGMGKLGPNEDECVSIPDLDSLTVLPWDTPLRPGRRPTCSSTASPTATTPAGSCAARWRPAAAMGYLPRMGVEPEVYVLRQVRRAAGSRSSPPTSTTSRPGATTWRRPCWPTPFLGPDGRLPGRARLGRLLLRPRGRRRAVRVRLRLHRRPGHGRPHGGVPADGQARGPHAAAASPPSCPSRGRRLRVGRPLQPEPGRPGRRGQPVRRPRAASRARGRRAGRPRLQRARLPVHRRASWSTPGRSPPWSARRSTPTSGCCPEG